jgi:hypothetical protein
MENINKKTGKFFLKTKILNKIEEISKCLAAAVEFNLPTTGRVNLVLSEKNGRMIYTLIDNEFLKKGIYSKEFDISNIPRGEYLYRFKTKNIEQTRELKLIK